MAEYSALAGAGGAVSGALAGATLGSAVPVIGTAVGAVAGGVIGALGGFGGGGPSEHGPMTTYRRALVAYGYIPDGKNSLEAAKLLLVNRDPAATQMALNLGVHVPRVIENYTRELQKAQAKVAKQAKAQKAPKLKANPRLSVQPWVETQAPWQQPVMAAGLQAAASPLGLVNHQVTTSNPIPSMSQQDLLALLLLILLGGTR